jgi:hypothetical protein
MKWNAKCWIDHCFISKWGDLSLDNSFLALSLSHGWENTYKGLVNFFYESSSVLSKRTSCFTYIFESNSVMACLM